MSEFAELNPVVPLDDLVTDASVSFIPMDAVEDDSTGNYTHSVRTLSEVRKGYTPFANGDVLWAKITPCMQNGKSCLVSGLINSVGFGSTEFHVVRVKSRKITRKFLWEFLNQAELLRVARYAFTGSAGHQRVPQSFLEELPFPLLPPKEQERLTQVMAGARAERRAKLTEADVLLSGLDDFLQAILGFIPPSKDDRKVFVARRADVPARFDPHFHLPSLAQNTRMLIAGDAEPLGSLVSFSNEVCKPASHAQPTFRYIEISNVNSSTGEARAEEVPVAEAPSRARMAVRTGDTIVSLTRPHHGSIAQITPDLNGCIASTGFSVLRDVDERLNRDYLWCVLRSRMCLLQMLQRASGGNYPAITEPELAKVLLPVPKPTVQSAIAAEVRRRREEARRLRTEAEAGWQTAKRWFEDQLLGAAR